MRLSIAGSLLVFIMILAVAGGVVWIRTVSVRDTYQYVKQEQELVKIREELQDIRVQWLSLTSPGKLVDYSKKLNLVAPKVSQTFKFTHEK